MTCQMIVTVKEEKTGAGADENGGKGGGEPG